MVSGWRPPDHWAVAAVGACRLVGLPELWAVVVGGGVEVNKLGWVVGGAGNWRPPELSVVATGGTWRLVGLPKPWVVVVDRGC